MNNNTMNVNITNPLATLSTDYFNLQKNPMWHRHQSQSPSSHSYHNPKDRDKLWQQQTSSPKCHTLSAYRPIRLQRTQQTTSSRKYGNFMASSQKLYRIWMRSFPANFWSHGANPQELNSECQQRTSHRPTDRQRKPTKCWKITSTTSSTMIKTIGISFFYQPNKPIIIQIQGHIS